MRVRFHELSSKRIKSSGKEEMEELYIMSGKLSPPFPFVLSIFQTDRNSSAVRYENQWNLKTS